MSVLQQAHFRGSRPCSRSFHCQVLFQMPHAPAHALCGLRLDTALQREPNRPAAVPHSRPTSPSGNARHTPTREQCVHGCEENRNAHPRPLARPTKTRSLLSDTFISAFVRTDGTKLVPEGFVEGHPEGGERPYMPHASADGAIPGAARLSLD